MTENKKACCKNDLKPSRCSKKDNNFADKAISSNEIRKEVSKAYSQYAKDEPQCKCKSAKYDISLGYTEEDISDENISW